MSLVSESIKGQPWRAAGIFLGIALIIAGMLSGYDEPFILVVLFCGIPIIWGAIYGVIVEHDITADVLVAIALVACTLTDQMEAAAEVSVIMQIGSFLEEATVSRATRRIKDLGDMVPDNARVLRDGKWVVIPVSDVKVGDLARVVPGEVIPVDGIVRSGRTSVDTSAITGEPVPVDVAEGDEVSSGTTNSFGSIDIEVTRCGEDSTISRIVHILDVADANKSHIVRTADRWARWIVVIALTVAIATLLITGDYYRAVTVLVVFCPCALILATPTAIMAAAGNLSKRGVLIKDGGAVETLAGVDVVLMDKTGTLTTGVMACIGFESTSGIPVERISRLASSLETRSEHPLGKAIAAVGGGSEVTEFVYRPGLGVQGTVEGASVCAGNARFMEELCPSGLDAARAKGEVARSDGFAVVYVGIDGVTAGFALVSDTIKGGSTSAVEQLNDLGVQAIMVTGDDEATAEKVRGTVGINDVVWECLPEDKLHIVEAVRRDHRVCMVGDGINDAPAMKLADVGISMGMMGTGIARDASDIVFMDDDIGKLPGLFRVARRTLLTIKAGISFSMIINTSAMVLAVFGAIGPVAGALVHNIGSVIVIIAAAFLMRYDAWSVPAETEHASASRSGNADSSAQRAERSSDHA